jgi:putative membrane protein
MTGTQSDLAGLSRYIFRAPRWYTSIGFALLLAAVVGVAAFDSGDAGWWRGIVFLGQDAWKGVFFIGVPTVVASLGTAGVDRFLGGRLTANRSSLLALVSEVLIVVILTAATVLTLLTPLGQRFVYNALVVALASAFAFRLLVIMAVSRSSLIVASIPASIQTAAGAALLFVYSGTVRLLAEGGPIGEAYLRPFLARADRGPSALAGLGSDHFAILGVTCVMYALGVYAFLVVIDRPWRRGLGVSMLDFLRGFIGHVAEGTRELEGFFEQLGQEAVVPVTVLSFRRLGDDHGPEDGDGPGGGGGIIGDAPTPGMPDGGVPTGAGPTDDPSAGPVAGRRSRDGPGRAFGAGATADGLPSGGLGTGPGDEKARFVLPMIHPGPMGEIGGGNFPERLARRTEGLAFPPHATAGHDFNLVTEREVDTVLDAAADALDNVEYDREGTRSVRTTAGEAKVLGQSFGDDALLINTYADDVEYAVGLSAAAEARTAGLDDVMLVDAHNCNYGLEATEIGQISPGSQRSFDFMSAAGTAGEALTTAPRGSIRMGVAWDPTEWEAEDGIGPLGVRVAVLEVAGQTTAYVLVDGNNMAPGLRDRIVDTLTGPAGGDRVETPVRADGSGADVRPGLGPTGPRTPGGPTVDAVEVMTTDTHIVNTVQATNRVGASIDHDDVVSLVRRLATEAMADREPVEAGMATERAEVTVFGNDRTETLASHANAVVAMGGALALAVTAAAFAVSALVFFLT